MFLRASLVLLLGVGAFAQTDKGFLPLTDYVKDWQISKQFTLDVAEKMPESDYGFKPTPDQMTFGEQMIHIGMSMVYRFWQMTGTETPYKVQTLKNPTKADIIKLVGQSYDYVIAILPKVTAEQLDKMMKVDWKGRPEVNGRTMMLNMFVHAAHHRAQAEMYLRLKGVTPPVYTF